MSTLILNGSITNLNCQISEEISGKYLNSWYFKDIIYAEIYALNSFSVFNMGRHSISSRSSLNHGKVIRN